MSRLHLDSEAWKESLPGVWILGPAEAGAGLERAVRATRLILKGPTGTWWIDAGPNGPEEPHAPDHGLITHSHPDHFYGMPEQQASRFWLSHSNPQSWQHESYVADFWTEYAQVCDLGSGICREECIRAFPSLASWRETSPTLWTQALLEAIRLRCRDLHAVPPPLGETQDLEKRPLEKITIHGVAWYGWDLGDLVVLPTRGHAPDHVVAYWRPAQLWILGDELSAVPVWLDSDGWASAAFRAQLAAALPDDAWVIGGHQGTLWKGALARQTVSRTNLIWENFEQRMRGCQGIDAAYLQWARSEPMHPILRRQVPHSILFAKQFMSNLLLKGTPPEGEPPRRPWTREG